MKRITIALFLFINIISAQNEWVLQPWIQVEGTYNGQKLGSSVGFAGKIGDSTQISVSDVNGIQMYRIKSPNDTTPRFFFTGSNCAIGDFNGDGIKDLVVGGNPTRIYLGKSVGVFDTIPIFTKHQEQNGYSFGQRIAVGKINGDQYDDILITDVGYPNGDLIGRLYLFKGGVSMDTIPDMVLNGEKMFSEFGYNVVSDDLNDDGYDDIIVKGYDNSDFSNNKRFVYVKVFLGGNVLDTVAWKYIKGGDNLGRGLDCFDVNGDGKKDLIWCNSNKDSMLSVDIHFSLNGVIDTIPSLVLPSNWAFNVANAGDMNGDGYNDILISSNYSDNGGNSYIFVYSGGPQMDTHFDAAVGLGGVSDLGAFGSIAGIGDINNDGYDDILSGALHYQWFSDQGYFGIFLGSKNIPITAVPREKGSSPANFTLFQNFPNPFNPTTIISYQLSVKNHVNLKVYNMLGQEIKTLENEEKNAGIYHINFDGSKLSSGVYYYALTVTDIYGNTQTDTKSMTLIK